jgi:hypothetical protein
MGLIGAYVKPVYILDIGTHSAIIIAMDTPSPLPLGLTRDAAHTYTWNDGTRVWTPLPSVTTILRVVDRSGPLVGWAKRETAACAVRNLDVLVRMRDTGGESAATDWLKRIPDHERDTAADIGTRVHRLVEQLARGAEPEVTPDEAPFVDANRRFLVAFRPRYLALEEMVASLRHGYAGTLDAIAVIGDEPWLRPQPPRHGDDGRERPEGDAAAAGRARPAARRAGPGDRPERGARVDRVDTTRSPVLRACCVAMAPPDGFEPPTPALGRLRSIH